VLVTFIPALELRASIPLGIIHYKVLPWPAVFGVCVLANAVMGIVVFLLIKRILPVVARNRVIGPLYARYVARTQRNFSKAVDKYGEWALAVFIGIPLPGTGAFSGALAAQLIGLRFRKFFVANFLGVLIAGVAVTAVTLTGNAALKRWLFLNDPKPAETQQAPAEPDQPPSGGAASPPPPTRHRPGGPRSTAGRRPTAGRPTFPIRHRASPEPSLICSAESGRIPSHRCALPRRPDALSTREVTCR